MLLPRFLFVPVLLLAMPFSAMSGSVEIIGHRGASHDAPENTLAAFRLCWEQKADAGELDIYLSKDAEVVVIHDAKTKRTTGVDRPVAEQTWEELKSQDAGKWKDAKFAGERIPRLADALATVPTGRKIFIEIKCGLEVLEPLKKCLSGSGCKPEQLVIIGFNFETMRAAKQQFPKLPVYWIVSYSADKKTGQFPNADELAAKAKAAGLDGLDLEAKFPLDGAAVGRIKATGLRLYTWTVDDPEVARRWVSAGVDGITTNRPQWLREQLEAK